MPGSIFRIEKLISSWDSESQTFRINRNAGIKPVKVDKELFDLIERSIQISRLTGGAFDISYASMDRIWKCDGSMEKIPTEDAIINARIDCDYAHELAGKDEIHLVLYRNGDEVYQRQFKEKVRIFFMEKGKTVDSINFKVN